LLIAGLHLAALSSFALAQPLFDLLGKNPDFLAAHEVRGWGMVLLALVLTLALPLVLLAIEAVAWLVSRQLQAALHLVFVAGLVSLLAIQVLKSLTDIHSSALIALAVAVGLLLTLAYARAHGLRSFVSVLSPAPLLFLVIFLFFSDANDLTFASGKASTANVSSRVPVVFVMLDEISAISFEDARGRVDPVLYPNVARFARNATWFRNTTAPTDETTTAAPAALSGRIPPKKHHVPIVSNYPHNLFTLLGRRYRMLVSQEATDLCPVGLCIDTGASGSTKEKALASDVGLIYLHKITPHNLEQHLTPVSTTIGNFNAGVGTKTQATGVTGHRGKKVVLRELGGGRPARFERFVRAIHPPRRPTLYFKHTLLPHVPWQYLPSGRLYLRRPKETIPGLTEQPSWRNPYLEAQSYQRHLLQAGFVDNLLGTLFRRLHREHLYDRALVVVTADNGEAFLHVGADPHAVNPGNIEDIANTPFFMKLPGQRRGKIVDGHVRTIDLLPTLADAMGIKLPWRLDGRSALHGTDGIPAQVEILERSGRKLTLSFSEYKRRIRASLERKLRLFGSGGRAPGLYGLGPHRELIGQSVAALRPSGGRGSGATVNGASDYRSVDLRSDFVPAQVTGSLRSNAGPVRDIAVAVNGRIAGVGQVFTLPGQKPSFSVLVPDRVFRQGRNRLQVFAVSGVGRALRLTTLATIG
jgi:hypothetical protein